MQPRRALIPPAIVACVLLLSACAGDASPSAAGKHHTGRVTRTGRGAAAPADRPGGASPSGGGADTRAGSASDPLTARASRLVHGMSVEQRAGLVIMTKLVGTTAAPDELELVRGRGVGGIILFGSNVAGAAQLEQLVATLDQAWAEGGEPRAGTGADVAPGLLVSVDQEGGSIRNIPFAPPEQTQPALGAAGDVDATRASAAAAGVGLARLGIDMSLGPVADLDAGPNHTMRGRSFGSDAATVARHVAASVEGLQAGGTAATTKHFPGFGASTANSDEDVAYVDRTHAQLARAELAPFRAAIAAGTRAVMVSHGIHRELGSRLPGTLDPRIVTDLLRGELGFEGVAMTDSMNARGLREAWGDTVPRACPVAIAAGIDMVLLTGSIETARLCRARIAEAVENRTLPPARLEQAAVRVTRLQLETAAGGARKGAM